MTDHGVCEHDWKVRCSECWVKREYGLREAMRGVVDAARGIGAVLDDYPNRDGYENLAAFKYRAEILAKALAALDLEEKRDTP